jgi:hypothetical protein
LTTHKSLFTLRPAISAEGRLQLTSLIESVFPHTTGKVSLTGPAGMERAGLRPAPLRDWSPENRWNRQPQSNRQPPDESSILNVRPPTAFPGPTTCSFAWIPRLTGCKPAARIVRDG